MMIYYIYVHNVHTYKQSYIMSFPACFTQSTPGGTANSNALGQYHHVRAVELH